LLLTNLKLNSLSNSYFIYDHTSVLSFKAFCEWDLLLLSDFLNLDFGLQTCVPKSEYPEL